MHDMHQNSEADLDIHSECVQSPFQLAAADVAFCEWNQRRRSFFIAKQLFSPLTAMTDLGVLLGPLDAKAYVSWECHSLLEWVYHLSVQMVYEDVDLWRERMEKELG